MTPHGQRTTCFLKNTELRSFREGSGSCLLLLRSRLFDLQLVNHVVQKLHVGTNIASPQTSFGVRLSRIHFIWGRNECVTNEPQRTSAGRLGQTRTVLSSQHKAYRNPFVLVNHSRRDVSCKPEIRLTHAHLRPR